MASEETAYRDVALKKAACPDMASGETACPNVASDGDSDSCFHDIHKDGLQLIRTAQAK